MRAAAILPMVAGLAAAGRAAAAEPDWTVDLGAAARVRPDHIGASHDRVDAVPVLEASYGDRLILSFDDGAKYRAVAAGPFAAGPIAEYRQSFNDKLPAGAFRMHDVVELGGFAEYRTPVGIAELRLRHAVGGYDGWSGDLSFSSGAQVTPDWTLGGQARVGWADSNFSREYFGLRPHAARRLGLPRFLDEDYVTVGGEFDAARRITPRTRLVFDLSADRMVGELGPSPLVSTRNILTASIGFTYHWSARTQGHRP